MRPILAGCGRAVVVPGETESLLPGAYVSDGFEGGSRTSLPAGGTGGAEAVPGEDGEREPHDGESDPPARGHGLVDDQHPAQELQDGCDVLQHADDRERDPDGRGREGQQRDGGDDARTSEERRVPEAVMTER